MEYSYFRRSRLLPLNTLTFIKMDIENWFNFIREIDQLIRSGEMAQVSTKLRNISLKSIPREHVAAMASLARRAQLFKTTMRWLNPLVRSERPSIQANLEEKLEYAFLLQKLGALEEAREILTEIDPQKHPQALLCTVGCLIAEWDYAASIPLLEVYVQHPGLSLYQRLVAQVNLAAALIYEKRWEEAERLLKFVGREAQSNNHSMLHGNCLELAAQIAILKSSWSQAESALTAATRVFGASAAVGNLWVRKWRAILASLKSGVPDEQLLQVRKEALASSQWETVRDCDFYQGAIGRDFEKLKYVYFGTPYESYRSKIRSHGGHELIIPESFVWFSLEQGRGPELLELVGAKLTSGSASLTPGHVLHRLLILLCQDFYKPAPVVRVFSFLYPGEYFNPNTSPNRVHQAINRLREWFVAQHIPLTIEEANGAYKLDFSGPFAILVPDKPLPRHGKEIEFAQLQAIFQSEGFTARQAREKLGVSVGTVHSLLNWALTNGKARKIGRGVKTKYKIAA